ncbi:MAG TPA: hypothetical protein VEF76_09935 [Patescibacteria group bacterium]|nr:hypothetical protein [Patescibacteria group bacterium]
MPKFEDAAETLRIEAEKVFSPRRGLDGVTTSLYGQPLNPAETLRIEAEKGDSFDQLKLRDAMDDLRRQISPAMRK